jgi:hypothetical protein
MPDRCPTPTIPPGAPVNRPSTSAYEPAVCQTSQLHRGRFITSWRHQQFIRRLQQRPPGMLPIEDAGILRRYSRASYASPKPAGKPMLGSVRVKVPASYPYATMRSRCQGRVRHALASPGAASAESVHLVFDVRQDAFGVHFQRQRECPRAPSNASIRPLNTTGLLCQFAGFG